MIKSKLPMDGDYEKRLKRHTSVKLGANNSHANRLLKSKVHRQYNDRNIERTYESNKRPLSYYLRKKIDIQDDRFIPARSKNRWIYIEPDDGVDEFEQLMSPTKKTKKEENVYQNLLQNEILNSQTSEDSCNEFFNDDRVLAFSTNYEHAHDDSPRKNRATIIANSPSSTTSNSVDDGSDSPYSKSGPLLSPSSVKLLRSPRKPSRKIQKTPFKVLDAPELADDFYLNLVDWSSTNLLAVGLNTCVYLWNAATSAVTRLCDLSTVSDIVTSVSWSDRGDYISVGTTRGFVQIWDVAASKQVTMLTGHTARVGALAWNDACICSGSRDRSILVRDIRALTNNSTANTRTTSIVHRKLIAHKQEVCGLKWSPDKQLLASGGNDNHLIVWSANNTSTPLHTYSEHIAAVKAIAWSPHQFGLLASGGGTADRCIRFWNTLTGQALQSIDTGSQVCNLAWSRHSNELVSTHGYSQNQIIVWKCPSMKPIVKLTGHSYRVLYLACSPDGESIVTGAGDETLRFWNIFHKTKLVKHPDSALNLFGKIR
ncbi:hypothetical protein GJ496_001541 [Pomphorhynchus laevis]|nr:hypothetical protein GJ496_001541 [Pomphorhynchus laevis]